MLSLIQAVFFISVLFAAQPGFSANLKLISLSPAATEVLFALGLDNQIIGNTTFCDYPEAAKKITKVGTFSEPNIEKIIFLKPDIIFTAGLEQAPTVQRLQRLGFKIIVSEPKNIPELLESIIEIGSVTAKEKEAESVVSNMHRRIEAIKAKVERIPQDKRPKVFIEIWYDPIMTAGPGSIVAEILNLAGGINIAYDTPRSYSRFSSEIIIERDPDVIILGYMSKEDTKDTLSNRLGWGKIKAVRNKRVISNIDPDIIFRPCPRIVDGLEAIYKNLYE